MTAEDRAFSRRERIRLATRAMRAKPSLARRLFPVVSVCGCGAVFSSCEAFVDHLHATRHAHGNTLSRDEVKAAQSIAADPGDVA